MQSCLLFCLRSHGSPLITALGWESRHIDSKWFLVRKGGQQRKSDARVQLVLEEKGISSALFHIAAYIGITVLSFLVDLMFTVQLESIPGLTATFYSHVSISFSSCQVILWRDSITLKVSQETSLIQNSSNICLINVLSVGQDSFFMTPFSVWQLRGDILSESRLAFHLWLIYCDIFIILVKMRAHVT